MKRVLRIVGIIVAVLLLVILALPFLVNVNAFRPTLETELSEALGRQVKVGNLRLFILSGSVAAEDLSVADDPAFSKEPFIRAKALAVGVELAPLIFSKTLHVTALTLDRPEITLLRSASGTWNFSSLGDKSHAASSAKPGRAVSPNLSVSRLNINDGRVSVSKVRAQAKPQVYDKVNVEVRGFSFTSQFPFSLSAALTGGGKLKLEGKAGPIEPADVSLTPFDAQIKVSHLDLAAPGFVEPSSGMAGSADLDGSVRSDGKQVRTNGALKADKLKLSPKGSPAGRPVEVKYGVNHNLRSQSGTITQGDVSVGKAIAHLSGTYQTQGNSTLVNMKLNGQNMPVDELQAMLPALGVVLPSGSSLRGGTLSADLAIAGSLDKPVTTGPIRLADTRLAGFDLGEKLAAISALAGSKTGADTLVQLLSTTARVAPEGIRTDNISLIVPALGEVTGSGTISPSGALDYKMNAKLTGGMVQSITQLAGLGGGGAGSVPFLIRGTTSNPSFVPDVQGMLSNRSKPGPAGSPQGKSPIEALTGLFGQKKKPQ